MIITSYSKDHNMPAKPQIKGREKGYIQNGLTLKRELEVGRKGVVVEKISTDGPLRHTQEA